MSKKTNKRAARRLDKETTELPMQMVIGAHLFGFVEELAKRYLKMSAYDQPSQDFVANFAFAFRQEAFRQFGHDSIETFALGALLKLAQNNGRPRPPRLDAVSFINGQANKALRLDANQTTAAEHIASIWMAFGRFRMIGGRGMEGGGGGRGQNLSPMDVMSEEIYEHHRTVYTPWYDVAKNVIVAKHGGNISMAAVIFKVLIEDFYPDELDKAYSLIKGQTLRAVKAGLAAYWSPERLADFGKRPAAAQAPAPAKEPEPPSSPPSQASYAEVESMIDAAKRINGRVRAKDSVNGRPQGTLRVVNE